ncbi:MAG: hypothetical protein R3236_06575, partial [Phycisphaeraceae bacterium]|nr:hypothetical protein [Phycisphaeraceae bacterium]
SVITKTLLEVMWASEMLSCMQACSLTRRAKQAMLESIVDAVRRRQRTSPRTRRDEVATRLGATKNRPAPGEEPAGFVSSRR